MFEIYDSFASRYFFHLHHFLSVNCEGLDDVRDIFILRGLTVYYGRHYWAYFYCQMLDNWFKFNDERITPVGNFTDVVDDCINCKAIPKLVFYERSDIITYLTTDGDKDLIESD